MAEDKSEKSDGKSSSNFDQYEYVSVIAPGAALLVGAAYLFPKLMPALGKEDHGLAGLGLLLIAAFVVGHLLAGIGELIEWMLWNANGGMPTDWVLKPKSNIISDEQRKKFAAQVKTHFGEDINKLDPAKPDDLEKWRSITRQIYDAVRNAGRNFRIDAFNRTYGFCRNLGVAMLVLFIIVAWYDDQKDKLALTVIAIAGIIAFTRMYVFARAYGRELLVVYIDLAASPPPAAAAKGKAVK